VLALRSCSLVGSTHLSGGEPSVSVGFLGGVRMDYSRLLPLVHHAAILLQRKRAGL